MGSWLAVENAEFRASCEVRFSSRVRRESWAKERERKEQYASVELVLGLVTQLDAHRHPSLPALLPKLTCRTGIASVAPGVAMRAITDITRVRVFNDHINDFVPANNRGNATHWEVLLTNLEG